MKPLDSREYQEESHGRHGSTRIGALIGTSGAKLAQVRLAYRARRAVSEPEIENASTVSTSGVRILDLRFAHDAGHGWRRASRPVRVLPRWSVFICV
jgi:hypothetical protein